MFNEQSLNRINLDQLQKPKTLLIVYYKKKRISIPLFEQCYNITEIIEKQIDNFQKKIIKNSNYNEENYQNKLIYLQTKKQQGWQSNKLSQGDLKMDIILSLIQNPNKLHYCIDITKFYKYMQVQPFYINIQDNPQESNIKIGLSSQYYLYRLLYSNQQYNNYLVRKIKNGKFYTLRVYQQKSYCGDVERKVFYAIQQKQIQKASCLLNNVQIHLLPDLQQEQDEQYKYHRQQSNKNYINTVNNKYLSQKQCHKYLAIVYPYHIKGTLKQYYLSSLRNQITELQCLNYLKNLMFSIYELHEKYNLIHRNLTQSTIEITCDNKLKICNYGSCLPCYNCNGKSIEYGFINNSHLMNNSYEDNFQFNTGQLYNIGQYTPPEVKNSHLYDKMVDYYNVGKIISQLYSLLRNNQRDNYYQSNVVSMNNILKKLMSKDLNVRTEIVKQILQGIFKEKQCQISQKNIKKKQINFTLQNLNVGKIFDVDVKKKYIENLQEIHPKSNGIQHHQIMRYFSQKNEEIETDEFLKPIKKISSKHSKNGNKNNKNNKSQQRKKGQISVTNSRKSNDSSKKSSKSKVVVKRQNILDNKNKCKISSHNSSKGKNNKSSKSKSYDRSKQQRNLDKDVDIRLHKPSGVLIKHYHNEINVGAPKNIHINANKNYQYYVSPKNSTLKSPPKIPLK